MVKVKEAKSDKKKYGSAFSYLQYIPNGLGKKHWSDSRLSLFSWMIFIFFGFISFLFLLGGCSNNGIVDSEAGNPSIINSNALIHLPSSITGKATSPEELRTGKNDPALTVYLFVRAQTFFVNELIHGNKASIKHFIDNWIAKLPWKQIKKQGGYSLDSLTFHIEAGYDQHLDLPYSVLIENRIAFLGWKIQAQLNGDPISPKGWIYYFIETPLNPNTDSLEVLINFAKTGSSRTLDIKIDQKLLISDGDQAQSFIFSWFEQKGIIHLSGCTYHPFMDSILANTVGHCLSYSAIIDTQNNLTHAQLGVPPADYNDTLLLFSEYGLASSYGHHFIDYKIPQLSDSLKMVLVTSYKDSLTVEQIYYKLFAYELVSQILGDLKTDTSDSAIEKYIANDVHQLKDSLKMVLATSYSKNINIDEIILRMLINPAFQLKPETFVDSITLADMRQFIRLNYKYIDGSFTLHDPSEVLLMTVQDLTYFLELNANIINPLVKMQFAALLWVLKLEQPVYFNANGYIGNGSQYPPGFEDLMMISNNRPLFKPFEVKILEINPE